MSIDADVLFEFDSGKRVEPKWLVQDDFFRIIMFHDGIDLLPEIALSGLINKNTIVVFSFSWFRSTRDLQAIERSIKKTEEISDVLDIRSKVILLMNSHLELELAQQIIGNVDCVLVNNTCFLNVKEFSKNKDIQKKYDAVLNAKSEAWKRHILSKDIKSKIFITYKASEKSVDVSLFKPSQLVNAVPQSEVDKYLQSAWVGLCLSETEGACYASTEYLLAGLPVVSTASFGGRDELYSRSNSLIVPAESNEVLSAVEILKYKIQAGQISSETIRFECIEKLRCYRNDFVSSLEKKLMGMGVSFPIDSYIWDKLDSNSKFDSYRNFWVRKVIRG